VWENATIGTLVETVSATDSDSGDFGKIQYYIDDGALGQFVIDPQTVSETTMETGLGINFLNHQSIGQVQGENWLPERFLLVQCIRYQQKCEIFCFPSGKLA
jgi:hypothetical protein